MKKIILPIFLFLTIIFLTSCGGPPKSEIKWAVRQSLKQRVPVALAHHLTVGSDAHIEELRIIMVLIK